MRSLIAGALALVAGCAPVTSGVVEPAPGTSAGAYEAGGYEGGSSVAIGAAGGGSADPVLVSDSPATPVPPAAGGGATYSPLVARPGEWRLSVQSHGSGSYVSGGVPFPRGLLRPDESVRASGGAIVDSEVLATWGDGSVKWLFVEMFGGGGARWLEPGEGPSAPGVKPPTFAAGDLVLVIDGRSVDLSEATWSAERESMLSTRMRAKGTHPSGIEWMARYTDYAGSAPGRLRFELRNPTPTGTIQRGAQPSCKMLGCEGTIPFAKVALMVGQGPARVRWEAENGCSTIPGGVSLCPGPMELRPGEQFGWEVVIGSGAAEPPLLEYSSEWACASGALGPMVPVNYSMFGDYERNNVAGAVGLHDGRARPHWRNPREHGEDQRDWDGGDVNIDFQTHNNEYETTLTYAKQRLRTMGTHATSRDWHYLGLTGTRHFANVDIYHVTTGPLPWMHGAVWQHVKHGGTGQATRHRSTFSPNMAHHTGRGLLAWYYLTGDPLLLDSFGTLAENARWRIMNGPGMPGLSNTHGEERAPANALGIMLDSWIHTKNDKYLEAAKKVVRESHANTKPFVTDPNSKDWKAKPWMIALLVVALDEFIDACEDHGVPHEADEARESAGIFRTMLVRWMVPDATLPHLPYQVSNDPQKYIDDFRDSWNVVGADALCEYFPDEARKLFRSGSRCIWHTKHPVGKYAKMINHIVMSGWGHRYMKSVTPNVDPALLRDS